MRGGTLGAATGCSPAWWGEVEVRRRLARISLTPRCWRLGDAVVRQLGKARREREKKKCGWR